MEYREIFIKMLKDLGITGKRLSQVSGVQERQISLFRNGKQELTTQTFFGLIDAADSIKPGARQYFAMQFAGGLNTTTLAQALTNKQLGELLIALADRVNPATSSDQSDEKSISQHSNDSSISQLISGLSAEPKNEDVSNECREVIASGVKA